MAPQELIGAVKNEVQPPLGGDGHPSCHGIGFSVGRSWAPVAGAGHGPSRMVTD